MNFALNFFLTRFRLTKEDFFKGVFSIEDALILMEQNNIVSYDLDEISQIVKKNITLRSKETVVKKKTSTTRKKSSSSKSGQKTTRTRRRTPRTKKPTGGKNDEKKDSSYFKTWKVPYVEPE